MRIEGFPQLVFLKGILDDGRRSTFITISGTEVYHAHRFTEAQSTFSH